MSTKNEGTWSIAYVGKQRLWQDPCNAERYTKFLGYVDIADDTGNPFSYTKGAALEAFGYIPSRPNDRMGIAYFYNALNDDFKDLLSAFRPAEDIYGAEAYYNVAVTPWFHLSRRASAPGGANADRQEMSFAPAGSFAGGGSW